MAPTKNLGGFTQFGFSVLLADDNEVNLLETELALTRMGCQVELARSGEEAVNCYRQCPREVVFMDCQMPEMDGFQASEIIRDQEHADKLARSYIVALTATVTDDNKCQCLLAGMDTFLGKPLVIEHVEQILQQIKAYQEPVVLDKDALSELMKLDMPGESTTFAKLTKVFIRTSGQLLTECRLAQQSGDFAKIRRLSHSFKSSSATMGAMALAKTFTHLEVLCHAEPPSVVEILQAMKEVEQLYPRVVSALTALMPVDN
jgi:two-component system sensor histidine kinase/response regulator